MVTANKALLAKHGLALAKLAEKNGVTLKFEAAAAGGIPIVKALREGLIAHGVDAVKGILNGTCNYILTEMESSGRAFAEVLKEAQAKGYAEADPTLDVGGGDTAHKLALLASLAFGTAPDLDAMAVEGIEHITPDDIAFASEFGFRIKLLGIARRAWKARSTRRCIPPWCGVRSALANVSGAANGVLVDAGEAGSFLLLRPRRGRGAHRQRRDRRYRRSGNRRSQFCFWPSRRQPETARSRRRQQGGLALVSAFRGAGRARRAGLHRREIWPRPASPSKA